MIRIAVIGAGQWGPNLIRNFHYSQRSEVAWVVDLDSERLKTIKAHFPGVGLGADPFEAIADPSVDAVVIATPASTHYELTKAALEHDRHVLVEKPICTNSGQGTELCDLADERCRVLLVGHVFLHNPAVHRVKQYLEEGALGRIYYLSMVRTNLGPVRSDVNAAWDLAAHDISIANYWLQGRPRSASGVGGAWLRPGVEDAVFATLHYPDDVIVHLHTSWLNPRKSREVTVVGDTRMLTLDDMSLTEPVRLYERGVDGIPGKPYMDTFASFRGGARDGNIVIPPVTVAEPLRKECDHFLDCIEKGQQPSPSGREAVAVVRALEAIETSVRRGGESGAVEP